MTVHDLGKNTRCVKYSIRKEDLRLDMKGFSYWVTELSPIVGEHPKIFIFIYVLHPNS